MRLRYLLPVMRALMPLCLLLAACAQAPGPAPDPARPWVGAAYRHHAVAVSHPLAGRAALQILNEGGSAVDAAIAAQMVMTLVEPQASGIGGGGFLLRYDAATKTVETYDGRETAPASATEGMFLDHRGLPIPYRDAILGGRAVGVPGAVRLLEMAHRDHGRLPWARLFADAIRLSRNGFAISERLARQIAGDRLLPKVPAAKAYFYDGDKPKPAGAILKNPALAETLEVLAAKGADAFYEGPVAEAIAQAVTNAPFHPVPMTAREIAGYTAKKRPAVCAPFQGFTLCGMGPPSSGGIAVAQIMGLLSHFPLAAHGPSDPASLHLIAEASRLAFADRAAYLGDPDFVAVPTSGLVDPGYLAGRARLISPARAMDGVVDPGVPPGATAAYRAPAEEEKGLSTAHMSIVDRDGNAVSFTTTVESAFGSRLFVRGFLLNNQLTDFSFRPEWRGRPAPNRPGPGKRPRSSMSPTIVLDRDGRFVLAVGSPGGSSIIGYTARAALGVLAWNLDMQAAIDLPHVINRGGETMLEEPLADKVGALAALGHQPALNRFVSGLQGLRRLPDGTMQGGADARREGVVLGDAGPAEALAPAVPYKCGGTEIAVAWGKDQARVADGGDAFLLARVMSGSGARYSDGAAELWEHQGTLSWKAPGRPDRTCRKSP